LISLILTDQNATLHLRHLQRYFQTMPTTTEPPPETETEASPWVEVAEFESLDQAYDHGLVILAMGEACKVERDAERGTFALQAEPQPAPKIERELAAYAEELSAPAPARPFADWAPHDAGWPWIYTWIAALLGSFYMQVQHPTWSDWGASSAIPLFRDGEWWRPFTALFLHADLIHLGGNLLFGVFFTYFVGRSMGAARGWPLIILCGAAGNALTDWIHYPDAFVSIGASTAVFAALGLLSGSGVAECWHKRPKLPLARVFAPLLAGFVLLGMLGSSNDPRTDVLGHACGFLVGTIAGTISGFYQHASAPAAAP
jgi:membrane associated rhomboid family serine protease